MSKDEIHHKHKQLDANSQLSQSEAPTGLDKFLHEQAGPTTSLAEREAAFDQQVRDLVLSGKIDRTDSHSGYIDWVNPKNLHALGHAIMEHDQVAIKKIEDSIKDPKERERTLAVLKQLGLEVPADSASSHTDVTPAPQAPATDVTPPQPAIQPATDTTIPVPAPAQETTDASSATQKQQARHDQLAAQYRGVLSVEDRADGSFLTKDTSGNIHGIYYPDGVSYREFEYGNSQATAKTVTGYDIGSVDADGQRHNRHLTSPNGYDWSDGSKGVLCPSDSGDCAFVNCDSGAPSMTVIDKTGKKLSDSEVTPEQKAAILAPLIDDNFKWLKLHEPFHFDNPFTSSVYLHRDDLANLQHDNKLPGPQRLAAAMLHTYLAASRRHQITNDDKYMAEVPLYAALHMNDVVSGL